MKAEIKERIDQINNGIVPSGYKNTVVGIIPTTWTEHKLGEFLDFKNGLNKEKEAFGSGTPIVNYTDVWKKRGLLAKDIKGKVSLTDNEIENYLAKEGDVFFTRTSETSNEIGLSSVLLENIEKCVFSGFVLRGRPKNKRIANEYHQYCYSSDKMRHEVIKKSSITTRALTNGRFLSEVRINLPSLKEQKKIAEIIMEWDKAIELQQQLVAKLEQRKKALMQKLLTPQEGWISQCLNKYLSIKTEYVEDKKCVPVAVGVFGIRKREDIFSKELTNDYSKNKVLRKNQLCFGIGTNSLVYDVSTSTELYSVSPAYTIYEIFGIKSLFVKFLLDKNNKLFSEKYLIISARQGKAVDFPGLLKHKIKIPSIEVQEKIEKVLTLSQTQIQLQQHKLAKLIEQRKNLMQLLLTGIVRVAI